MRKTMSRSIAVATAAATMLSAVAIQPVAAAPLKAQKTQGVTENALTDVSAQQRRHRRGNNNANAAVALGAVGLVFGTIAGLAAADQRRRHQEQYYGGYGYQPHYAPYAYAPPPAYYGHPGYRYGYR